MWGGGGCHCHQGRQWEGAAEIKMAHFGKGIKRVAESAEKLLQRGLQGPRGDRSPEKFTGV